MKLTVDCVLTHQLSLPADSALARLLNAARVTQSETPLEALVSQQFGLKAMPDFPIAAISAAAEGLEVGSAYWQRADPVHLVMQRDCFTLGEPAPLVVAPAQAVQIIDSLNQHFFQDGLRFCIGKSGAWYVRSPLVPEITTVLPSVAAGKNIHQFLPQGADARKWRSILNEVQMLLHEHPANLVRESAGEAAVNSVWFSGGGVLPEVTDAMGLKSENDASLIVAQQIFYQGLAHHIGANFQSIPVSLDGLLSYANVRLQLPEVADMDGTWFSALLSAVKRGKISQLTLHLGFYEKCLIVNIVPSDMYLNFFKFWRKSKPVMHHLS